MGNALWQFLEVTEELLGGLATTKSSTELHGRRSRASGPSLVLTSWRLPEQTRIQGFICIKKNLNMNSALPVCSPVTLGLISARPWSSGACGTSVAARQSPLEGRWDDLGGQVEVIPQVLDTLVGQVPAMNFSLNHCILHMNLKTTFFCIFR